MTEARPPRRGLAGWQHWRPAWLLLVLAAFPVLLMTRRVSQATQMNYQDYWDAMLRITDPNGGLKVRGLFTYQNEHPFFVPQVIYYLDARLGTGSNRELGYFAVLMALVTLFLLWRLLPAAWSGFTRAGLLAVASLFTLCPTGAWNFVKGMSGTAWLTANVFALLAILLAWRGRTIPATVLALIAIASYGTGFAAPVAVIAVLVLIGQRWRRWAIPLAALLVSLVVYKATNSGGPSSAGIGHDVALLLQTFLTNLSTLWDPTGGSLGLLAGAGGLAAVALCFVQFWQRRDELADLVPWWGVTVYALSASALISIGRSAVFAGDGAQARYVSLSALFWTALVVIALRTAPSPRQVLTRAAAAGVAVLVFWGASPALMQAAVGQAPRQDLLAAAVRFQAAEGFSSIMAQPDQQIQRLQALHDYPFVSGYTVGCGLKPGASVDLSKVQPLPASVVTQQRVAIDADKTLGNAHDISGWVYRAGFPTQCAILVDSSGKVVGGGSDDTIRTDVQDANPGFPIDLGFEVVAPVTSGPATLLLGFSDGLYSLPADVARPATGSN